MKVFNTCVLFAIVALASLAQADPREEMKAMSKACLAEAKVTEDDLHKFFKGGMKPEDAIDGVKCHMKCMMEKRGSLKNGEFDEQAFIQNIQNNPAMKDRVAELTKVAADCKKEKGANPCDTAFKIQMCFKGNREALGVASE